MVYGKKFKSGTDIGVREGYYDIAATIMDYLNVKGDIEGDSFLSSIAWEEKS